jgi:mannose-1-phosphate guanylyltransferase
VRAMVLAAGLGTRLRPLTHEIPKPVVPVLGRPLCGYAMEFLREHGATAFLLNLHHGPDTVRERVLSWAGGRFPVTFTFEPQILGTGGGIGNAREFLGTGTFFTANADVVVRFPLGEAVARHRESGALATLVLFPDPERRYTPVRVREDGRIAGFGAHAPAGPSEGFYTGYQVAEPELLEHIPKGRPSCIIRETYEPLVARGAPVFAFLSSGTFLDFGTPRDYLRGTLSLLSERGGDPRGFVHPRASVSAGASLGPGAVIEEGGTVGDGATVRRAIVWPGASVPPGRTVEDGILTPVRFVPARTG